MAMLPEGNSNIQICRFVIRKEHLTIVKVHKPTNNWGPQIVSEQLKSKKHCYSNRILILDSLFLGHVQ